MKAKAFALLLTSGLILSFSGMNANEVPPQSYCTVAANNANNDGHCIPHPEGTGDYCECGYEYATACNGTLYR